MQGPDSNSDLFTLMRDKRGTMTRTAPGVNCLETQFSRNDIRKYTFAVRRVENWNRLPNDIRSEVRQERFKEWLKGALKSD